MVAIRKHCFSDNKSARNQQARGIYFIHLKKKKKRSILITEMINIMFCVNNVCEHKKERKKR